MTFINTKGFGGPEVFQLGTQAIPTPLPHEVLIRVEAAGINRPDILQREGRYPPPLGASPILGLEVAGVIEKLGGECGKSVREWKVGDRVCALIAGGGYAEYCTAPSVQCLPIPDSVSMEEAAGIPETFFTVWSNIFTRGRLKPGESILIHGGTSGIGTTAIQLAKAFGARVFATAGTEEKCEKCIQLGAEGAINYKTQDFVTEIQRLNQGKGIDLILDMVAGEYFARNLDLLAQEGRIVQIAVQKGEEVKLSLSKMMKKGATITGSTLRPKSIEAKAKIAQELFKNVWPFLESRKVQVILDRVYPLAEVAEAHKRMEKGENIGKIILKMPPSP